MHLDAKFEVKFPLGWSHCTSEDTVHREFHGSNSRERTVTCRLLLYDKGKYPVSDTMGGKAPGIPSPYFIQSPLICLSHTESPETSKSGRSDRHRQVFDAWELQSALSLSLRAGQLHLSNLLCYLALETTKASTFWVTYVTCIKIFRTSNFSFLFLLFIAPFASQTALDSKLLLALSLVSLPDFNWSKFLQPS